MPRERSNGYAVYNSEMAKWLRSLLLLSPIAALALVLLAGLVGALLPSRHRVTESAHYRQEPAAVWAVLSDFAALPAWDPLVQRMERLPDRGGHPVWREHNGDGSATYEIAESIPPRRQVLAVLANDAPFRGTWTFDLAPGPPPEGGSRLALTARGEVGNPFFRFLLRFVYGSDRALDVYLTALGRRLGREVPSRPLYLPSRSARHSPMAGSGRRAAHGDRALPGKEPRCLVSSFALSSSR
jgi:hypothetical protein